jgi:TolB protein
MQRRLISVSIISAVILLIALTVAGGAAAAPAWVLEQLVTADSTAAQQAPSYGQSGLAWEDDRNGDWDVYLTDMGAGWSAAAIPAPSGDQRHPSVSPDSPWVAYEDDRNENWDIYAYNTETRLEVRVTKGSTDQLDPAVSGTRVVFEDRQGGGSDIRVFDLAKKTTTLLAKGSALQVDPAIEGSIVAWADKSSGNWDVMVRDLRRTSPVRVTANRSAQTAPCVGGQRVAYVDDRNASPDIYLYSLATDTERRITTNGSAQTAPALSGDWVVYQDARDGAADIYGTQLVAGVEKRLTDDLSAQQAPAVWHSAEYERMAWQDERTGDADIYYAGFRTPYLRVEDPDRTSVPYNGATSVFCELQADDSYIPGALIWKYDWRSGRAVKTSISADIADGAAALKLADLVRKTTFRVVFRGDDKYVPVVGPVQSVDVTASLRGVNWKVQGTSGVRSVRVVGTLRPRHTAGNKVIHVFIYSVHGSSRSLQASGWAKAADASGSASSFTSGVLRIPPGVYQIRVTHDDADHALTVYDDKDQFTGLQRVLF